MDVLVFLIPAALFLGLIGLAAFLWSLKSGQFDDLDGAAMRILIEEEGRSEKTPEEGSDQQTVDPSRTTVFDRERERPKP